MQLDSRKTRKGEGEETKERKSCERLSDKKKSQRSSTSVDSAAENMLSNVLGFECFWLCCLLMFVCRVVSVFLSLTINPRFCQYRLPLMSRSSYQHAAYFTGGWNSCFPASPSSHFCKRTTCAHGNFFSLFENFWLLQSCLWNPEIPIWPVSVWKFVRVCFATSLSEYLVMPVGVSASPRHSPGHQWCPLRLATQRGWGTSLQ